MIQSVQYRPEMNGEVNMTKPAKNTICLWYDRDAEEAARFYAIRPSMQCTSHRETFHRERKGMC
jgi:hypothetical protein